MPELNFKGKEFVYNHHLTVPFHLLEIQAEKGIGDPVLDGNLIIHGDNLKALKALMPLYAGKVDCIFIDPPYNTGNEGWCYNDNVNSPMIREWLDANPIGVEDGLRHDKWACMMWPRLKLLHELLAEGAFFFASIDHNEVQHFRSILDEIFGTEGFVANIAWQKRTSPEARKRLGPAFDTILVFRKTGANRLLNKLDRTPEQEAEFSNPDNDPRGPWTSTDMTGQNPDSNKRKDQQYKIELANGEIVGPPRGRCWAMLEPEFLRLKKEGRIWFGVDGDARPRVKTYLSETEGVSSWTWWPNEEVGHNQEAKKEILQILDEADFDYPKPVRLLSRIVELALQPNGIILDSFAGSGTTAHAVLAANARDDGNRRFLLVEGEDYADRLTTERVRRAINGYSFSGTQREELLREPITFTKLKRANSLLEKVQQIETLDGPKFDRIKPTVKDGVLIVTGERDCEETAPGLGGSFTYCTLGDAIDMDGLLTGQDLPAVESLAALLYHTATAKAFDPANLSAAPDIGEGAMRLGEANGRHLWLFYKPDLEWLKSAEAAVTLSRARAIAASQSGDHLVFAPAKFVSRELLAQERLPVEYAPLPFALYRVETA